MFSVDNPKKCTVNICGLGFYDIFINGQKITKGILAPYISNPDHICYYDSYDVLPYLKDGENVFVAQLGNGMQNALGGIIWDFDIASFRDTVKLAFSIEIEQRSGEKRIIEADDKVLCKPSPIFFDDLRSGYLYDFGENTAGTVRLKIRGSKNQEISLQFCEYIDKDGNPSYDNIYFFPDGYAQRDIYICKGEGEEIFEPSFTYHGFRYCLVSGITEEQARADLLTALIYNSNFEKRSHFECSDAAANTLYSMMLRSDLANFYYFPTDCPHREKNGWTGDANSSSEHLLMNFCCEQSFSVWLDNIIKAQDEKGEIPGIVPTGSWGYGRLNGPAWDRVISELPFRIYQFTGKTDDMKKMLPTILRYIDFVKTRRDENGLIGYGLGDWLQVDHQCDKPDAPVILTDSIMCMDLAYKTVGFLDILGVLEQRENVYSFYTDLRAAIREHLIDLDTMTAESNCQTAQAMCIYYGVFENDELPKATEVLLNLIKAKNNHFDCGLLGLRVIFHVLADMGEADLAYEMIMQPDYPSYKYFIDAGLTTFPEIFRRDYSETVGIGSLDHHYLGDIGNWFIRYITGIRIDQNLSLHNTVKIQPNFIKSLHFAKADYTVPSGKIKVSWERKNEKVVFHICAPENITAEVIPPLGYKITEKCKEMLIFEAV